MGCPSLIYSDYPFGILWFVLGTCIKEVQNYKHFKRDLLDMTALIQLCWTSTYFDVKFLCLLIVCLSLVYL